MASESTTDSTEGTSHARKTKEFRPYHYHNNVLPEGFGGGPHGLGDPDNKEMRKIELTMALPSYMRGKAKASYCKHTLDAFKTCVNKNGSFFMIINCRQEKDKIAECMEEAFADPTFRKQCKDEYLEYRTEYRKTGEKKRYDFLPEKKTSRHYEYYAEKKSSPN